MKKFVVDLMTNRFGIVLAALNVCYFVSKNFVNYAFTHGYGDECFFVRHYMFRWLKIQCAEFMLYINLPAIITSAIQGKLMQSVFPDLCSFTHAKVQIVFLIIFIILQWLFIGQTAKTIARTIRPNRD